MTTKTDIEQERRDFEVWMRKEHPDHSLEYVNGRYTYSPPQRLWEAFQAGRAALQSQYREDAEWMSCESRRPWVANSLKDRAKELRDAEKRSRRAFNKDYMSEPARYFADACGQAAAVFEAKLGAIDHARRIEGEAK